MNVIIYCYYVSSAESVSNGQILKWWQPKASFITFTGFVRSGGDGAEIWYISSSS